MPPAGRDRGGFADTEGGAGGVRMLEGKTGGADNDLGPKKERNTDSRAVDRGLRGA